MKFDNVEKLASRMTELEDCAEVIKAAVRSIVCCHKNGGKLLIAGCGGSAADSEHISGELLKGFLLKREPQGKELAALTAALNETEAKQLQRGVRAIPLVSLTAVSTAYANDVNPALLFAQEVYALGQKGDVFLGISTSGNSEVIVKAAKVAKALGLKVISLTGKSGGKLSEIADIVIKAPACETYLVQEYHLPIYHAICADVERILFEEH